MDERVVYAAGGVVAGVAIGIGATYMWFQKRFEVEFNEALNKEIAATKQFYATLIKPSPEDMVRERGLKYEHQMNETAIYKDLVGDEYAGEEAEKDEVEEELAEIAQNVFTNFANNSTWDADKEEAERDTTKPYVISHDEFFENEPDHIQAQLVWFAEDGVLADSEDKPVDEAIVGEENLEKFGHGSRDPNLVYIRNEAMDIDFEISYAEGKYSEQVMGFIQHEDRPIRKFRLDED